MKMTSLMDDVFQATYEAAQKQHQQQQEQEEQDDEEQISGSSGEDSTASTQPPDTSEKLPEPLKLAETLTMSDSLSLPSRGSVLHGTGNCRPCAWFWKPEKCSKGEECTYCHLCPEGEIKARKKIKDTAMRMGAIEPLKEGSSYRMPRVLNIGALV